MNIEIHGAGRAAGALALAADRSGHTVVAIHARRDAAADALETLVDVRPGVADLRILAVTDAAIETVASSLRDAPITPTVHLSGAVGVSALSALAEVGSPTGAFHPLQTLPDPVAGADRLAGCWVAVTADEPLASTLDHFARSLGCRPFPLNDDDRVLYHAAAVSVANFTVACLGLGEELMSLAGVPFEATRPLVETAVANAFLMGARSALTGPVVRGDLGTVKRHLDVISATDEGAAAVYRALARGTAIFADAGEEMLEVIG